MDPAVRNGLEGPEFGKDIRIGDDCWLGGNVTILPGITMGRGSTIGAGSMVTRVNHCAGDSRPKGPSILIYFTGRATIPCSCWQSGQDLEENRDEYGHYGARRDFLQRRCARSRSPNGGAGLSHSKIWPQSPRLGHFSLICRDTPTT